MPNDQFLIAPFNSGLINNMKPWQTPEDSFELLNNAYSFRGWIRKRFGSVYMGQETREGLEQTQSRLRIALKDAGTGVAIVTDGAGNASGTVPGNIFAIGQMFQIGTTLYTVYQNGSMLQADFPVFPTPVHVTATATYDTATGAFNFVDALPAEQVYFYPSLPVMGIDNYQVGAINNQPSYAFDTRFAYVWTGAGWDRSVNAGASTTPTFSGTNSDFFWVTNWRGAAVPDTLMFVTNFVTADRIWYFDGTTWAQLPAQITVSGDRVETARIIIPFEDRLILLNTVERISGGNQSFQQRARWSAEGSPLSARAWLNPGEVGQAGASYLDAATKERIVGAEFIKNHLIVYFESSTWELVVTNNSTEPFIWQKLNTELGSQSTFSTVPFDREVLAIGNTGVHSCNGSNVSRIDNDIPDNIFQIRQRDNGIARVCGIRDYFTEMVYWTLPSSNQPSGSIFPNKVLVYNYKNQTWGYNDDSITTFGYFEQQAGITWAQIKNTWEDYNGTWSGGQLQSNFRQVLAGNQQGYIFIVNPDVSSNAGVLQINSVDLSAPLAPELNVTNNNLRPGDFVQILNAKGLTHSASNIFKVVSASQVTGDVVLSAVDQEITGVYEGGGTLSRVSKIQIRSKQWNPYVKNSRNIFISRIDFCFTRTATGEVFVDYFPSASNISIPSDAAANGSLFGTSIVETRAYTTSPLELNQQRVWHPLYLQCEGNFIQIELTWTDEQMINPDVSLEDFNLEGMILNTRPTTVIFQ